MVDMNADVRLFDAPSNPPNTGTRYTSGTDLFAHKARSGTWYYYKYSWSMWQGESSNYELIDADDAKEFLLEMAEGDSWVEGGIEYSRVERHFPGLFDEDA